MLLTYLNIIPAYYKLNRRSYYSKKNKKIIKNNSYDYLYFAYRFLQETFLIIIRNISSVIRERQVYLVFY